jgi:hypothetical protein
MKNLTIVVSRYKEDVAWVKELSDLDRRISVKIYNKHNGENALPNVGREGHTYVTHIVENYDSLDDTIFLQGNPFDHEIPKGGIKNFIKQYFASDKIPDYYSFNTKLVLMDKNGYPWHRLNPLPLGALYEKIFGKDTSPDVFEFTHGACFFASKDSITNIPLNNWKILLDSMKKMNKCIEVYCLERLWQSILLQKSSKTIDDVIEFHKTLASAPAPFSRSSFPKGYLEKYKNGKIEVMHHRVLGTEYKPL